MNFLAVDDNKYALNTLVKALADLMPSDTVYSYTSPSKAMEFINSECEKLSAAFLDIEMPGVSGIELAVSIKKKFPKAIIIFVTAYFNYSLDAFKVHANGYLIKPISKEMLEKELIEINQPFLYVSKGRVRALTFGNFELFVDNQPVKFTRSKSKELMAYLIDRRGAACTMKELTAVLFEEGGEEKAQSSYLRNIINDLKTSLGKVGAYHIIKKTHNEICVDTAEIDCDYYRLLQGEPSAINMFFGEYMTNYTWAELTLGEIYNIVKR